MTTTNGVALPSLKEKPRLLLVNTLFFILVPIAALIGVFVLGWSWAWFAGSVVAMLISGICITAGYHRLYAHRSYEAHPVVEWAFLILGSAAFQGSVLKWATEHRRHHRHVDTTRDPHNVLEGLWWAHIGWIVHEDRLDFRQEIPADLRKNKRVQFQHKYYIPLAIGTSFLLPMLIGWSVGALWEGLVFGSLIRLTMAHHSTFAINSFAHYVGRRPYDEQVTARDNAFLAFLTYGEGYHNYHHRFPSDYRNGIRMYQFDPTKWLIWMLNRVGLTQGLRRVAPEDILQARLQVEGTKLLKKGCVAEEVARLRQQVLEAQDKFRDMKVQYREFRIRVRHQSEVRSRAARLEARAMLSRAKAEMLKARIEFRCTMREWALLMKTPAFSGAGAV